MNGPDGTPPEVEHAASPTLSTLRPPSRRRWWWLGGGVLLTGALAASWFALPIRAVEVTGERHLSAGRVRELAGLTPGSAGYTTGRGGHAACWTIPGSVRRW
ncbi:hypothetical protein ACFP9V_13715 [Deinococcus radiopugnans]